jgi:endonuclease YncB( thermonuclease family)
MDLVSRIQLALIALFFSGQALADVSGTAIVVDGDTLSIAGIKVRLNGIDTPEKDQTCKANGLLILAAMTLPKQ